MLLALNDDWKQRPKPDNWEQQLLEYIDSIGGPRALAEGMERFHKSVALTESPEFRRQYADQWVAVLDGALVASAPSFDDLCAELNRLDVPRGDLHVTLVEVTPRTLIL